MLPVIFFHAGATLFSGGFVGVDVFFVISGYLITGIILEDLAAGRFSVWSFYERRFRRIAPAIVATCAVTVPFALAWLVPRDLADYAGSLLATALSASNFYFWAQAGYFAPDAGLQPLIHTWSLAVEEQFYLIFPVLLAIFSRHRTRLILALAIASLGLSIFAGYRAPNTNFYLLPTRFWELAFGALLAMSRLELGKSVLAHATAGTGLILILLSILLLDGSFVYPGLWALPPVVGAVMVLAAGPDTFVARLLSWRPLVGIGLISYSLYLWHQPIFAFARIRLLGHVTPDIYAGLIVLAVAVSYLSWRWVEQPFRNRARFSRRQIFAGTAVACAILVVLGLAGTLTHGFPQRQSSKFADLDYRLRPNMGIARCSDAVPVPLACMTDPAPEIIVWGDSFARVLVAGIIASRPSVRLVQYTKSACGPFPDLSTMPAAYPGDWPHDCIAFNDAAKAYIERTPSLRFAVLSSTFRQYLSAPYFLSGGKVVRANPGIVRAHLQAAIDWLRSHGVTPVLFLPPPRLRGKDIGACLRYAAWLGMPSDRCALAREAVAADAHEVNDLLAGIDVRTIDVADAQCDRDLCRTQIGDVMLYLDGGHLTYEGSEYLGRSLHFYDRIEGTVQPARSGDAPGPPARLQQLR
ncbi:MAG: acyltransferase [Rhizobiales bacterium]|nr:acyltransferase [Hyphomicrobiales bacterium]